MRSVPYFSDLHDEAFDSLMESVQLQRLSAGQTIFLKGENRESAPFHLVVEGTVRVYLSSLHGREQVLRLFHTGDTFGEVPLFDGGPNPASANALTDVTLAVMPRAHLLQHMTEYPELAVGVVKVMAERLRHFNTLIEDLSLRRVIGRVAHLLATEQPDALTQAQMATMIGASREMVNRSLHTLEDKAVIRFEEQGTIVVCDPEALAAIIDES